MARPTINFISLMLFYPSALLASGPKWIAGTSYFDPAVVGQPIHWEYGAVNYYVDRGPLNAQITNQQATAMVDSAAALWNSVSTAGLLLENSGSLSEDVNSGNVMPGTALFGNPTFAAPSDVAPSATNSPLAVIYDSDGYVIDSLLGDGFRRGHALPGPLRLVSCLPSAWTMRSTPATCHPNLNCHFNSRRLRQFHPGLPAGSTHHSRWCRRNWLLQRPCNQHRAAPLTSCSPLRNSPNQLIYVTARSCESKALLRLRKLPPPGHLGHPYT